MSILLLHHNSIYEMWAVWRSGRALDWESRGIRLESGWLHCHISHHPHVVSFIYQLNIEWPRTVSLEVCQLQPIAEGKEKSAVF